MLHRTDTRARVETRHQLDGRCIAAVAHTTWHHTSPIQNIQFTTVWAVHSKVRITSSTLAHSNLMHTPAFATDYVAFTKVRSCNCVMQQHIIICDRMVRHGWLPTAQKCGLWASTT